MHQRVSWPLGVVVLLTCAVLCFYANGLPQKPAVSLLGDDSAPLQSELVPAASEGTPAEDWMPADQPLLVESDPTTIPFNDTSFTIELDGAEDASTPNLSEPNETNLAPAQTAAPILTEPNLDQAQTQPAESAAVQTLEVPEISPLPPFTLTIPLTQSADEKIFALARVDEASDDELSVDKEAGEEPEAEMSESRSSKTGWPKLEIFFAEMGDLEQHEEVRAPIAAVRESLEKLLNEIPVGDSRANRQLDQLATSSQLLHKLATQFWSRSLGPSDQDSEELAALASRVSRFSYRLDRRRLLWQRVNQEAAQADAVTKQVPVQTASIKKFNFDEIDSQWSEYLQLNEFASQYNSFAADEIGTRNAARQTLARVHSAVLNTEQAAYIHRLVDSQLLTELKRSAIRAVEYTKLLADVESFEIEPTSIRAFVLNDHYQNLLWSDDPGNNLIAAELEAHYRNANLRVAVAEDLLNRMVPDLPDTAEPFSDRILGANVRGSNKVSNQLQVELIPDPAQIHLRLGTLGQVDSDSVAKRGGFTVRSVGESKFQVFKQILINRDGIDVSQQPVAHSSVNQRVTGLESKVDSIPVLGWVARRIAEKKIRSQQPESDRIVKSRVASSASERVHELVNQEVQKLRLYLQTNLLQPLIALDLEPQSVQLATNEDWLIARYRLAGRDQMAAHTARPSDDPDCLLNVQVHQSAFNNLIARLDLSGNRFTTEELRIHLNELLDFSLPRNDETPDAEAEFEFARFDPLRVDFEDDRVLITMNLDTLQLGSGKRWQKVSLTASYIPQRDGSRIQLVQDDEGKRIKGYRLRFRDRAAIGTIHQVLFKRNYEFDVVPEQIAARLGADVLKVSQLVVFDGWAGISLDAESASEQLSEQGSTKTAKLASKLP